MPRWRWWARILWLIVVILVVLVAALAIIGDRTPSVSLGFAIAKFFLLIVLAILYFLPAIVALNRDHRNTQAIFALDLLAGWTVIGWIVALVWAYTAVRET